MTGIAGDLKGRSLVTLNDLTDSEMLHLVELASELKEKRRGGDRGNLLRRKHIAMIFEKMSTRTRCATAVAAYDEGAHVEYLGKGDIHLGKKESVPDTARVLGRMFDGIMFRGYLQETVESLARYAGIPVWNGLTNDAHPTQALADLMTIKETFNELRGTKVVYVGDGRNNVANSLMLGCAKAGIDFVNCTPPELAPDPVSLASGVSVAEKNGCRISVDHDPMSGVVGANVVYTDVWVSMGEEGETAERLRLLKPYQVDEAMMARTGNVATGQVIFLHCLPAYHDANTAVSGETGAQEVTDGVFEAAYSKVFDQAENRMHTIKAVMVASIGVETGGDGA